MDYQRKQYGTFTNASLLLVIGLLVAVQNSLEDEHGRLAIGLLMLFVVLVGLLFMSLTVTVNSEMVKLSFGLGLVHRNIPLDRIQSATPVRNSLWYGFGIRLTPRGWMWNIHGLSAVELAYKNGKHFRIGTADPEGLAHAIQANCGQAPE